MNETIKTFYENKHVREAVLKYLQDYVDKQALSIDFTQGNEDIGAKALALRNAGVIISDAFNSMAELTTKKGDKPKPNDAL